MKTCFLCSLHAELLQSSSSAVSSASRTPFASFKNTQNRTHHWLSHVGHSSAVISQSSRYISLLTSLLGLPHLSRNGRESSGFRYDLPSPRINLKNIEKSRNAHPMSTGPLGLLEKLVCLEIRLSDLVVSWVTIDPHTLPHPLLLLSTRYFLPPPPLLTLFSRSTQCNRH